MMLNVNLVNLFSVRPYWHMGWIICVLNQKKRRKKMNEFGRFDIDTSIHEPLGDIRQTKKGFIQKWLIRNGSDAQVITVFANEIDDLQKDVISVRIPGDFCFAVDS